MGKFEIMKKACLPILGRRAFCVFLFMETTLLSEQLIVDYVKKETGCALILVPHSLQQTLDAPQCSETRQFLEFYGV